MIQKITTFKFSGISELHIKDCNIINYVKLSINVGITKAEIMSFNSLQQKSGVDTFNSLYIT